MSTFFFLVGFVGSLALCLLGFLSSVLDSCRDLNPFTWGFLLGASWFPFAVAAGLPPLYKNRFEKTQE